MRTAPSIPATVKPFDVAAVRADFPILSTQAHGKPLVYLDNAATSQKPKQVIEATSAYYSESNANVHRGIHYLSDQATRLYEGCRDLVQRHINALHRHEVIFTKGTTESINLVASSFGQRFKAGDEVLISGMEHHANIVPWHLLAQRTGIKVRAIPVTDTGEIDIDAIPGLINENTRLVAVNHVSNSLGTINPVKEIIAQAHYEGVPVLLDGAQAMPHMLVDVQELGVDFYAFSGHKLFGPTGTGVLYGKEKWINDMPPYQGGGDMIDKVTLEYTTFNAPPHVFEAGTPNIAGFAGLGAAIDYYRGLDHAGAIAHEQHLLKLATERLLEIPGLRIIGTAPEKVSVISFVIDGIHPSDVGTLLDHQGIAVRTGHHCTQPLMDRFSVPATTRASFAFYNTVEEVDRLFLGLQKVIKMFR
ncbi:MAG: cysteine desulfurase [Bacteroidia bacterium]